MANKTKKPIDNTYTVVGKNIYQIGNKYRVRVSVHGTKYDEYFTNKAKAIKFRNDTMKLKTA